MSRLHLDGGFISAAGCEIMECITHTNCLIALPLVASRPAHAYAKWIHHRCTHRHTPHKRVCVYTTLATKDFLIHFILSCRHIPSLLCPLHFFAAKFELSALCLTESVLVGLPTYCDIGCVLAVVCLWLKEVMICGSPVLCSVHLQRRDWEKGRGEEGKDGKKR